MAPRLPVLSARELIQLLERLGFVRVGQTGSHVRLKRRGSPTRIVVVPYHPEIAPGTLKAILRRAGMSKPDIDRLRR